MFGNVLKFYYNSTVPIVPVASLYTFLEHQLSGFQYHLYLANKQEPRGEARHKSQYCLMFLIYRRLTLKLTSGICRFICLFVFTESVFCLLTRLYESHKALCGVLSDNYHSALCGFVCKAI